MGSPLRAVIYGNAFLVGGVLMGYEMLGSRYLYPYFGGGIGTWAGLISVVLSALTLGYFAGGAVVDRFPSLSVLAIAVSLAGVYLAGVPITADPLMVWIVANFGYGLVGILLGASALIIVPVLLLGTLSPVAIRLLIRSKEESGSVAGVVYGVSTIGNVFGTLVTTFVLIPTLGSRTITYFFTATLLVCAATLAAAWKTRAFELRP